MIANHSITGYWFFLLSNINGYLAFLQIRCSFYCQNLLCTHINQFISPKGEHLDVERFLAGIGSSLGAHYVFSEPSGFHLLSFSDSMIAQEGLLCKWRSCINCTSGNWADWRKLGDFTESDWQDSRISGMLYLFGGFRTALFLSANFHHASVPAGRAQRGVSIFEKAACLPFQRHKVTRVR